MPGMNTHTRTGMDVHGFVHRDVLPYVVWVGIWSLGVMRTSVIRREAMGAYFVLEN